MSFTEINLFGVYVAPISVIMVAAWFATIWLRWCRGPFRRIALCLAPFAIHVRGLHGRVVVDGLIGRSMADTELRSREDDRADRARRGRPSHA